MFRAGVFKWVAVCGLGVALGVSPLAHRTAHAGSGRTVLGIAAGALVGAAVLGAMSQAQAARPPAAPPKKPKTAASKSTSSKTASQQSPVTNVANTNQDPFAGGPAGAGSVPVADKP